MQTAIAFLKVLTLQNSFAACLTKIFLNDLVSMKMIYMSQNPSNLFWLICRHKSVIQTHDDTNNVEIFKGRNFAQLLTITPETN